MVHLSQTKWERGSLKTRSVDSFVKKTMLLVNMLDEEFLVEYYADGSFVAYGPNWVTQGEQMNDLMPRVMECLSLK